jgi:hypothetical protein
MARFNARFAVAPARPEDRHRPLTVAPDRLRQILCRRERRHVSRALTLSYDRLRIMLERNDTTVGLAGEYVDTYAFADGGLELRWRGLPLPYRAFDKDQRVSPCRDRREQAAGRGPGLHQEPAGRAAAAAGDEQQREERLPQDRAEARRPAAAGRPGSGAAAGRRDRPAGP